MTCAYHSDLANNAKRTVDVHIRRLRAKLGAAANIRTVPGVGYALDPPKAD